MNETTFTIVGILCFLAVCFLALAALVVLVIVLAKHKAKQTDKNWQQVADDLGLTYGRDELSMPSITGQLHGVDVRVGTSRSTRTIMRGDGSHRLAMIWTRVVATPQSKPSIEVWLKKNKPPQIDGLVEMPTGDADFDVSYRLLAPSNANVETVCPPALREVMLQTPREVQIIDQVVVWTNKFINKSITLLAAGLESTAQVARAIDDHAGHELVEFM